MNNAVFARQCKDCTGTGHVRIKLEGRRNRKAICSTCSGEGYIADANGRHYHVPMNASLFMRNGKLINPVVDFTEQYIDTNAFS